MATEDRGWQGVELILQKMVGSLENGRSDKGSSVGALGADRPSQLGGE